METRASYSQEDPGSETSLENGADSYIASPIITIFGN